MTAAQYLFSSFGALMQVAILAAILRGQRVKKNKKPSVDICGACRDRSNDH